MLKYANFRIFIKLFTTSNLSPYFEKVKYNSVYYNKFIMS